MSTLSGIPALMSMSLIAIVAIQFLSENIEPMIENFTELTENFGEPISPPNVAGTVSSMNTMLPTPGSNSINDTMYNANLTTAIPNEQDYALAGSGGDTLIGGQNQYFAQSNTLPNERADNLSLCAQNTNTFGTGLASSLLPKVPESLNGFETCGFENVLAGQNFLSASAQIGTDTVSSSLRNGNLDLRSDIPNPVTVVSPWLNTTIQPDLLRRPLECTTDKGIYGCGPQSIARPVALK